MIAWANDDNLLWSNEMKSLKVFYILDVCGWAGVVLAAGSDVPEKDWMR